MASTAFCVCFARTHPVPLQALNNQANLKHTGIFMSTSSLSVGSSQAVSRTGMKIPNAITSNKGKCIVGRRYYERSMRPFRHVCSLNKHRSVSSGVNIVISGYWVGPGIEDGCGYTEAVVVQLYDF